MKYLLIIFTLCTWHLSIGQFIVDGHIYDHEDKSLEGSVIYFTTSDVYTTSNKEGYFKLNFKDSIIEPGSLIISHIGYENDTFYIREFGHFDFSLSPNAEITTIVIRGRKAGTYISREIGKIEVINQVELTKSACCDLAGCFNTQGSVQVNTTNQITNSKELRLLGVSGVYNQILLEGMPLFIGNSLTYGISQLSGTMINAIMVSKGTTSILQGYDAMSGQINVLLKKYDQIEPLMFNAYINNFGEKQFNINSRSKVGPFKVSNGLHFVLPGRRMDIEGDGFLNMPLTKRVGIYQTWEYGSTDNDGYASITNLMYTNEQRIGGQFDFKPEIHRGSAEVYGQDVRISQPSIFSKHYYRWNQKNGIGLYASYQYHEQESWMGLLQYRSIMQHLWSNIQYERQYGQGNLFKAGISMRNFESREQIALSSLDTLRTYAGDYYKNEFVPGVFAENLLELFDHKVNIITGIRLDQHNVHGLFFTPRFLLKYDIDPNWTYRLSAGKGYRTINSFADYPQIIASNRNMVITENLKPEIAYTLGNSLNHKMSLGDWVFDIGVDLYYTYFENQVFPDFDSEPTTIFLHNSPNSTRSISAQADIKAIYNDWLELKASYNYLDVGMREGERIIELPFIQKHRITSTLSIRPANSPIYLDMNFHINGSQRLPNSANLPEIYQYDTQTPVYTILNAQLTYKISQFEFYGGCENITGFLQRFPFRSYQEPFGPYFDITTAWGPTRGREWYFGLRYTITEKD